MGKIQRITDFIAHFKGSEETFLHGCCYWFSFILFWRFRNDPEFKNHLLYILYTQNQKEPSSIKIKTSDAILKSLAQENQDSSVSSVINSIEALKDYKEDIVGETKVIEHISDDNEQTVLSDIYRTISEFTSLCQKIFDWHEENELIIQNQEAFTNDISFLIFLAKVYKNRNCG